MKKLILTTAFLFSFCITGSNADEIDFPKIEVLSFTPKDKRPDSPLARSLRESDERMKLELIGKYGDINAQNIIASLERTGNSLDQNKALLLRNAIDKLWKTKKFRKYMKKKMAKEEALIIFRGKLSPRARQEPEAFSRLCDLLYGLHRHNR